MDGKDVTVRTLPHSFRRNRRGSAAFAAVVAVTALFISGCDKGESTQVPYPPSMGGNDGSYVYDDGYPYDDGGNNPGRFDPKPPQGPYSP